MMSFARIRLVFAALALAAWLGFLGYLALGHAQPPVVSRSQMLLATYVVKADVDFGGKAAPTVIVRESFGPHALPPGRITVDNLLDCKLPSGANRVTTLTETGAYLLLLEKKTPESFRVVAAPGSSGNEAGRDPLIYRWSDDIERQIKERSAGVMK